MHTINQQFSRNLKNIMKANNKSVSQVARNIGVSNVTVYAWLNGQRIPRPKVLDDLSRYLMVSIEQLTGGDMQKDVSSSVRIPVLGNVRAGIPLDAIEDIIDYEEIPETLASTGEYFALQIKGNSMEPRMYEGDVVIVKKQNTIECGQIAIVLVNGHEATCKKIRISNNGITLIGFNPDFQPITYSAVEIMSLPVQIIGRVVECRQKY